MQQIKNLQVRSECHNIEFCLISGQIIDDNKERNDFVNKIRDYTDQMLDLADNNEHKAVIQYVRSAIVGEFTTEIIRYGLNMRKRW